MKPQAPNREILLFTETSFAKRQLCELNDTIYRDPRGSVAEQLERACWSKQISDMLPDLFKSSDQKKMSAGEVNQAEQFLQIKSGSTSNPVDKETSVDPYFFLTVVVLKN